MPVRVDGCAMVVGGHGHQHRGHYARKVGRLDVDCATLGAGALWAPPRVAGQAECRANQTVGACRRRILPVPSPRGERLSSCPSREAEGNVSKGPLRGAEHPQMRSRAREACGAACMGLPWGPAGAPTIPEGHTPRGWGPNRERQTPSNLVERTMLHRLRS
jgi:hypothetical protein